MERLRINNFCRGHWSSFTTYLNSLVNLLRRNYDVELYDHGNRSAIPYYDGTAVRYAKHCIIIEWVDRREFKVIDLSDPSGPRSMSEFLDIPNCIQIFKAQYNPRLLFDYPKVNPFYYYPRYHDIIESKIDKLRDTKRGKKTIFFRGNLNGFRSRVLRKLAGYGLVCSKFPYITPPEYYDEMACHRLALSLPGNGLNCHREIEGFAVGTPVIMPEQVNVYATPLIPNYHYIPVVWNKQLGMNIIHKFYEVIDDVEFLNYVSENAKRWYDKYARIPNAIRIMAQMLGLKNG